MCVCVCVCVCVCCTSIYTDADALVCMHAFCIYTNGKTFLSGGSFSAHLSVVLADPAPWDKDHCYRYGAVEVYYEEGAGEGLVQVPLNRTLNEVLSSGK